MAWGDEQQGSANKRRFAAFISYSHADAAAAAKLQKKLERYRLPKHIVTEQAREAAGLGQIFRDREDLAAAASLSDAIRAAIADAEALIVLCSPDAAASQWVAAEIALFRELHPDRPVLAALVRGEPAEAFPLALTENGREPLAADLRPGGDGGSLGFLKIVAGIAGVPLDTLVQRDAQRRVRRVTGITAGAIVAMLIMAIMTTLALSARNEAARQRASAEGLVEYMLTDLREKLKGVGRLDVMEGVNARAMEHYRGQGDLSGLSDDALERRARILHLMGEDDQQRGNLAQAHGKFSEAHRTTSTLLSKRPKNPDRIFGHAQSEFWVGNVALNRHDIQTAKPYYERYKKLADQLGQIDPNNAKWRREQGFADGNLCTFWLQAKADLPKAMRYCQTAFDHMTAGASLAPDDPEIAADVVNRLAWLAEAQNANGDLDTAVETRRRQLVAAEKLCARDPKNSDWRELRIIAQMSLAKDMKNAANHAPDEASALLARAVEDLRRLVDEDPGNEFRQMLLKRTSH